MTSSKTLWSLEAILGLCHPDSLKAPEADRFRWICLEVERLKEAQDRQADSIQRWITRLLGILGVSSPHPSDDLGQSFDDAMRAVCQILGAFHSERFGAVPSLPLAKERWIAHGHDLIASRAVPSPSAIGNSTSCSGNIATETGGDDQWGLSPSFFGGSIDVNQQPIAYDITAEDDDDDRGGQRVENAFDNSFMVDTVVDRDADQDPDWEQFVPLELRLQEAISQLRHVPMMAPDQHQAIPVGRVLLAAHLPGSHTPLLNWIRTAIPGLRHVDPDLIRPRFQIPLGRVLPTPPGQNPDRTSPDDEGKTQRVFVRRSGAIELVSINTGSTQDLLNRIRSGRLSLRSSTLSRALPRQSGVDAPPHTGSILNQLKLTTNNRRHQISKGRIRPPKILVNRPPIPEGMSSSRCESPLRNPINNDPQ